MSVGNARVMHVCRNNSSHEDGFLDGLPGNAWSFPQIWMFVFEQWARLRDPYKNKKPALQGTTLYYIAEIITDFMTVYVYDNAFASVWLKSLVHVSVCLQERVCLHVYTSRWMPTNSPTGTNRRCEAPQWTHHFVFLSPSHSLPAFLIFPKPCKTR